MAGAKLNIEIQYPELDIDALIDFIIKNADDMAYDMNHMLYMECVKKARSICKSAVDSFYRVFPPALYKRHNPGSLYSAYDVGIKNGDTFVFFVGSDLMDVGHHQSNDIVFDVTFMHGAHGGHLRSDGKYYWRYPSPNKAFELGVQPYSRWYRTPAPMSKPPYERICEEWDEYLDGEYKNFKKKVINTVIDKYLM